MNIPAAQTHRRVLRRYASAAERRLWRILRTIHITGVLFRRQVSIGRYIVDFYVPRAKLAIELDGESHQWPGRAEYDARRQREIEARGIEFLRFTDDEVDRNARRVAEAIEQRVREKLATPRPICPPLCSRSEAERIEGG